MQPHKSPAQPLARNANVDVLDWQEVDRSEADATKDMLGLSREDRRALGLSAPRNFELESPSLGGSEVALADVLARGGALGITNKGRGATYRGSDVPGKTSTRQKR